MTGQVSFPDLARQIGDAVRTVMDELRPQLVQAALATTPQSYRPPPQGFRTDSAVRVSASLWR
jgi:hypothetical protein